MLPDGNSPPDVFFLLLFVQSFNAITSDTSPHQMSVLSFPLKKLTDDGPDSGNYYVRTVTANFNHNVPGEQGSKSKEQPGRGAGTRGGVSLLFSGRPARDLLGCSPRRGCSGVLVHGARRTHAPRDRRPFPAPSAGSSACAWAPRLRGRSPGCGFISRLGLAVRDALVPGTVCSAPSCSGTSPPGRSVRCP